MVATIALVVIFAAGRGDDRDFVQGSVLYTGWDANAANAVRELRRLGLYATTDPRRFEARLAQHQDVVVFTRTGVEELCRPVARGCEVSARTAGVKQVGDAYVDGALIAGLDLSLNDLGALIFGASSRPAASRDPNEPMLSMLYEESLAGGCDGHGYFSDRLANWPAARLIPPSRPGSGISRGFLRLNESRHLHSLDRRSIMLQ